MSTPFGEGHFPFPLEFGRAKTSEILRDFGQLQNLIVKTDLRYRKSETNEINYNPQALENKIR